MTSERWVPTDDDLLAFDRGLLPEAEMEAVVGWLEAHPEGEARLQHLTKDRPDPASQALRQTGPPRSELDSDAVLATHICERVLRESPADFTLVSSSPTPPAMPATLREYRLL